MLTESLGQWRIFTQKEFDKTLRNLKPSEFVSMGFWDDGGDNLLIQKEDRINTLEITLGSAIKRLRSHIQKQKFEHGQEGKLSRAHIYRPYRLTLDGELVAAVVLRASEAYNLCEIDVFLTASSHEGSLLDVTRAALLFAFSDAAKNAGSMAIQFSKACAPGGLPPRVRALADQAGVELKFINQGSLSPSEVRELFLRFCGLSEPAQVRVRDFAQKRFFSIERICYLISQGLWPAREAEVVLCCAPFPDLILGGGADANNRHLVAQSIAHARVAVLSGIFDRVLRYVRPLSDAKEFIEQKRYLQLPSHLNPDQLSVTHGPISDNFQLSGWSPHDEQNFLFPKDTILVAFIRPRLREEIRVFLKLDIEQARKAEIKNEKTIILLVYPSDFLQLSKDERIEASQVAKRVGVNIVVCPESVAGLDAEVYRRQRIGRTVRQ